MERSPVSNRRVGLAIGAGVIAIGTAVGRLLGYKVGRHTPVRCLKGHLFTTVWVPGASLKAIRLGWWRLQRCPVGHHWSLVHPVKESHLSEEEPDTLRAVYDVRVP